MLTTYPKVTLAGVELAGGGHVPLPQLVLRPADRFALTQFNRRQLRANHFKHLSGGAVSLTEGGRKELIGAWQEWKTQTWDHPIADREVPAGLLPVIQARILARHLRGELPGYLPWTAA